MFYRMKAAEGGNVVFIIVRNVPYHGSDEELIQEQHPCPHPEAEGRQWEEAAMERQGGGEGRWWQVPGVYVTHGTN